MVSILITDDHPVVRQGLRLFLEARADFVVCGEASNGREAVELARALKPNVVVLDLSMPELNGLEATHLLKRSLPETEVLIFTMHHAEDLAAEVLAAGARGYVLKSDPPEDLLTAVDSLARHTPFFTRCVGDTFVQRVVRGRHFKGGMLAVLTTREREVVKLIAEGFRSREIAERLGVVEKTIETHRSSIMRKLQLESVADIVRYAVRNKIVEA